MSYMVARMQKMKDGNLGGAYKHNERIFENHSNKDIDTSRSYLNYELTDRDRSISYERQIKDYVNENKVSKRGIRKDAVLCDEWIITSDKQFFENLSQERTREFFETAKKFFEENYGKDNIAYASVHLDENTPHMHMGVVPFRDGKLSSKTVFDKSALLKIQDELPKYMQERGFDVERGQERSQAKHLTVSEFKEKVAYEELASELEDNFEIPQFFEETKGKFFLNYEEALMYELHYDLTRGHEPMLEIRPTTVKEKLEWVKNSFYQEAKRLEDKEETVKGVLSRLSDKVDEKGQEYNKIEQRASQKFSELSEVESKVKEKETHYESLKKNIEALNEPNRKEVNEVGKLYTELTHSQKIPLGGFRVTQEVMTKVKDFIADVGDRLKEMVLQNELLKQKLNVVTRENQQLEKELNSLEENHQKLRKQAQGLYDENEKYEKFKSVFSDEEWQGLNEIAQERELKNQYRPSHKQNRGRSR